MEIPSRFRRKKEPGTSVPENDPVEVQLKKWQELKKSVDYIRLPEHTFTTETHFQTSHNRPPHVVGGTFPPETYLKIPKGAVVKKTFAKDVELNNLSDDTQLLPGWITITYPVVESGFDGKIQESNKVMYIIDPDNQAITDYTDPELPKGKRVATNDPTFVGISALIKSRADSREEVVLHRC